MCRWHCVATEPATGVDRLQWLEATVSGLGDGWTVLRVVRQGDGAPDYVVIDANELVRDRWTPVVGDIIGMRLRELPGVRDNVELLDAYDDVVRTQTRRVIDFQIPLAGQAGGWRRATVVPLDADTLAVIAADIDRERYFEEAAEQERSWLSTLASGEHTGAFVNGPSSEARFMKRSAATLFVAAGIVALINSVANRPAGVDLSALRAVSVITMAVGALVLLLPWERHPRRIAQGVVVFALALMGVSDHFDHYAHAQAALAVYPVFFIMTVAWSGLHLGQRRGHGVGGALGADHDDDVHGGRPHEHRCAVRGGGAARRRAARRGAVVVGAARRQSRAARGEPPPARSAHGSREPNALERSTRPLARAGTPNPARPLSLLFVDLDRFKHGQRLARAHLR